MGIACLVYEKPYWKDAEFLGVFQKSTVIQPSPMLGGVLGGMSGTVSGGVIAGPVAVVKVGSQLKEVQISEVKFPN